MALIAKSELLALPTVHHLLVSGLTLQTSFGCKRLSLLSLFIGATLTKALAYLLLIYPCLVSLLMVVATAIFRSLSCSGE